MTLNEQGERMARSLADNAYLRAMAYLCIVIGIPVAGFYAHESSKAWQEALLKLTVMEQQVMLNRAQLEDRDPRIRHIEQEISRIKALIGDREG